MADPRDEAGRTSPAATAEKRRALASGFFVTSADPELAAGLSRQVELGYLDSRLPKGFKTRLFLYLARFCQAPSCLVRQIGLLLTRQREEGAAALSGEAILGLVSQRLASSHELSLLLDRLAAAEIDDMPEPAGQLEQDVIHCAAHVFLRTKESARCRSALRALLSPERFDQLVAFIGFAALARTWSENHPEIAPLPEVETLLARETALAAWIEARWPRSRDSDLARAERPSEGEVRLRLAIEAANALVYETERDGDEFLALYGLEGLLGEDAAIPRNRRWWLERVHPDDREIAARDHAGEAERLRLSYRVRHRDGHWVAVVEHRRVVRDDAGRMVGHIGIVLDDSAQHAVEEGLREHTVELESIVENMAGGVVVQDAEGRVVRVNRHALETAGLSSAETLDEAIESFEGRYRAYDAQGAPLPAREWPLQKARRFEAFHSDEVTTIDQLTGRRWTGLFSGHPMPCIGDRPRMFVTTFRDVTDRKRAEDEIRRSEQSLRELSERKDEFLAMLGHELRNPLSTIRNAADMLQFLPILDPRLERLRDVLNRQSAHMAKLVDGLLDAARVVRGKVRLDKHRLELGRLVAQTVEDRNEEAEQKGISIVIENREEALYLVADRVRLTQVIDNLLSNALKYSPRGGRITVMLRREDEEAILAIRDEGTGMSPELLAHLFEPFQQGPQAYHRPEGGLGLGLAVVRGLVERHGGTIGASSPGLGKGSTFEVRLPTATADHASTPVPDSEVAGALRVLVVEDEPDHAETLRMLLETLGHEVEVAYSGPEALEKARQHPPNIVLCDLGLPDGMTGYDVAEALCGDDATRDAYLIALTGFNRTEDRMRAERAGFDDFLAKPAGADAIQAAIRRGSDRAP